MIKSCRVLTRFGLLPVNIPKLSSSTGACTDAKVCQPRKCGPTGETFLLKSWPQNWLRRVLTRFAVLMKTRFVSYKSPLNSWSRQPAPTSSSDTPSMSIDSRNPATSVDLQIWMAKKAGMDANAQLCRFEVEGNCNDKQCSAARASCAQPI